MVFIFKGISVDIDLKMETLVFPKRSDNSPSKTSLILQPAEAFAFIYWLFVFFLLLALFNSLKFYFRRVDRNDPQVFWRRPPSEFVHGCRPFAVRTRFKFYWSVAGYLGLSEHPNVYCPGRRR
jgi:hypothetical protein